MMNNFARIGKTWHRCLVWYRISHNHTYTYRLYSYAMMMIIIIPFTCIVRIIMFHFRSIKRERESERSMAMTMMIMMNINKIYISFHMINDKNIHLLWSFMWASIERCESVAQQQRLIKIMPWQPCLFSLLFGDYYYRTVERKRGGSTNTKPKYIK